MKSHKCCVPGSLLICNSIKLAILVLVLLFPLCVGSATSLAAQSRFPFVISAGTHALTFPWYPDPVAKRLNPAIIAGAERTLKSGNRMRLYQAANLGFLQHHWWMTGVLLDTELGVSHSLPLGFQAEMRLGVGYMHYFWRRKTLELEDGRYVQATNWGKPSLIVPLSVTLGYRGSSAQPLPVMPFVSAQWAAQGLFLDEVPIMTHLLFLVGVRIDPGRPNPTVGR